MVRNNKKYDRLIKTATEHEKTGREGHKAAAIKRHNKRTKK